MKKFLNIFFVTLGVIFFILILIATYFYITDPLNLKPLIFGEDSVGGSESSEIQDKHPLLSSDQEKTLEAIGVDPSAMPSEITPEQEACFTEKIGAERVLEIKAGDSPSAVEFIKARECI